MNVFLSRTRLKWARSRQTTKRGPKLPNPATDVQPVSRHRQGLREIIRRLWPLLRIYWRLLVIGTVLTILSGVLAQANPLIMRGLVDNTQRLYQTKAPWGQARTMLAGAGVLFLAVSVVRILLNYGQRQVGERLKVRIEQELSSRAAEHLIHLDAAYFGADRNDAGRLAQRVERGAEGLAKIVKTTSIDLAPMLTNATGALVVMWTVSPWVGLVAVLTLPIYVVLARVQAVKQLGVRTAIKDLREERTGELLKVLSAIRVVQAYVREAFEAALHRKRCMTLAHREIRHHVINHICDSLKVGIDDIGGLVIVIASSYLVLRQQMPIGIIPLHYMLYGNITAPIRELHRVYTEYQEAAVFSSGLFEILDAKAQVQSAATAMRPVERRARSADVRIEHVSFAYTPGRRVLKDVSIELPSGQTIALVGLSGAGKSTLASLLSRAYDPTEGRVLLSGIDLRQLDLDWVREQVGVVLQRDFVFSGSIAENIRYGRLDATAAEVAHAASRAGLDGVLDRLAEGLDAPAHQLSGGEMQRIAIARAFLKDPPLLVLDEPTASLDALAAEQIKRAIELLRQGRTVLVISHSPALFVDASRIYVLRAGQVVEQGDHASLLAEGGHYADIIQANVESLNLRKLLASPSSE